MIVGVGIDLVSLERFTRAVENTPGFAARILTEAECALPLESQAARFAAKEALIKALGGPVGNWHDVEVTSGGQPQLQVSGAMAEAFAARGVTAAHVSLSHDGGMATAIVTLESA